MLDCNYKKSQIQQLKAFCLVVEYKSLTEAAKKLNTSIANVSKQITALEIGLNKKFFTKGQSSKLTITAEGLDFYHKTKFALQVIDDVYNGKLELKVEKNKLDIWKFKMNKLFLEYRKKFFRKLEKIIAIFFKIEYLVIFIISFFAITDYIYEKQLYQSFIEKNTEIIKNIAKNIDDKDKLMDKVLISNLKSWLDLHHNGKDKDIESLRKIKNNMIANNLTIWDGNTGKLILATNSVTMKGSPYYEKYLNYSIFDKEQCTDFKNMKHNPEIIKIFPFRLAKIRHFKPEKFAIMYDIQTNQYLNAMIDDHDEIEEISKSFNNMINENVLYLELSGSSGNIIFNTNSNYKIEKKAIENYSEKPIIDYHNNNVLLRMPFGGLKPNACYDINRRHGTKNGEYFYVLTAEFSKQELNQKIKSIRLILNGIAILILSIIYIIRKRQK